MVLTLVTGVKVTGFLYGYQCHVSKHTIQTPANTHMRIKQNQHHWQLRALKLRATGPPPPAPQGERGRGSVRLAPPLWGWQTRGGGSERERGFFFFASSPTAWGWGGWRWRARETRPAPARHHVTATHKSSSGPKNISNLPRSRGAAGSRWGGRPRERDSECILLLWRNLWITWYKSMLSSGGNSMHSWVPQSSSISCTGRGKEKRVKSLPMYMSKIKWQHNQRFMEKALGLEFLFHYYSSHHIAHCSTINIWYTEWDAHTCPSRPILTGLCSFHGLERWAVLVNGSSRL